MIKANLSPKVQEEIRKIQQKDQKLAKRIQKQITLFEGNPKHPSLRLHKLTGSQDNIWSISVSKSLRMLYRILEVDSAYFFDIGTHDQVYK